MCPVPDLQPWTSTLPVPVRIPTHWLPDQESTRSSGLQVKHTFRSSGIVSPTWVPYLSVTVNRRVVVTQQVITMLVGVMVIVSGSPAVMVISPVFVIVLPMAAASNVARPGSIPEVAVAVAQPVPPEVVVPERKASR